MNAEFSLPGSKIKIHAQLKGRKILVQNSTVASNAPM
jgi:hypothetical protein